MDTYDPSKVSLIIGGNIISGWGEGSFITASRDEDTWLAVVGSDGRVARARNANKKGIIQFTLLQTAPSNDVCSAMHNLDELTGTPPGASQIVDQLGNTLVSGDECFLLKPAEIEFDKGVIGRQWTLVVPNMNVFVGGLL